MRLHGIFAPGSAVEDNIIIPAGATAWVKLCFALPRSILPGKGAKLKRAKICYQVVTGALSQANGKLAVHKCSVPGGPAFTYIHTSDTAYGLMAPANYLGETLVVSPAFDNGLDTSHYQYEGYFTASLATSCSVKIELVEIEFDQIVS